MPKNVPSKLRDCFEQGIGFHHAGVACLVNAV
jgi:replicative superfamily II helicase